MWKRRSIILLMALLCCGFVFGETSVTLVDGEIITGEVVEHILFEKIVLKTKDERIRIVPSSSIISIEYDVVEDDAELIVDEVGLSQTTVELVVVPQHLVSEPSVEEYVDDSSPVISVEDPVISSPTVTTTESEIVALQEPPPSVSLPVVEGMTTFIGTQAYPKVSTTYSFGNPVYDYEGTTYRMSPGKMEDLFSRMAYQVPDISPRLLGEMEESIALMKKGNTNTWLAVGLLFVSSLSLGNGIENNEGAAIGWGITGFVSSYILLLRGAFQSSEGRSRAIGCVDAYNFLHSDISNQYR